MELNRIGPLFCQVSPRAPFLDLCYSRCTLMILLLYIKDIDSKLRLFADNCVCYREIKDIEDKVKLQEDIDRLACWARSCGMRVQPVRCNIMH